jgi:hypothetical protein
LCGCTRLDPPKKCVKYILIARKHSDDDRRLTAVVGNYFGAGEPPIPPLGLKSSVGMTILPVTSGDDGETSNLPIIQRS